MARKFEVESYGDDLDDKSRDLSQKIANRVSAERRQYRGDKIVYLGIVSTLPKIDFFEIVTPNCIDQNYTNYFYYDVRAKVIYLVVKLEGKQ